VELHHPSDRQYWIGYFGEAPKGEGAFQDGGTPAGDQPQFDPEEFRARFAKMRQEMEQIRSQAIKQIGSVLTKDQRTAFNKMLGKPFDLSKLAPGPGNRGRGNRSSSTRGQTKPRSRRATEGDADTGDPF
jgi:hypothetical protein